MGYNQKTDTIIKDQYNQELSGKWLGYLGVKHEDSRSKYMIIVFGLWNSETDANAGIKPIMTFEIRFTGNEYDSYMSHSAIEADTSQKHMAYKAVNDGVTPNGAWTDGLGVAFNFIDIFEND